MSTRRGAIAALVAIMLPVMLIMSALAINIAWLELCRTEMYVAADAAARATNRELLRSRNTGPARARGIATAVQNKVANRAVTLQATDFTFGHGTRTGLANHYTFTPGTTNLNAVQVTVSRQGGGPNGDIDLLFPHFLSTTSAGYQQSSWATQVEADIVLVLDKSGSMAYATSEPTAWPIPPYSAPPGWAFCDPAPPDCRWRDAAAAVDAFITELTNSPSTEKLALVTYSWSGLEDVDLTSNYATIPPAIDAYTNAFCSGGTNIGGGIETGLQVFANGSARPWASKVLVVMTDGIHNTGVDPMTAAATAAGLKVQIFTITFSDEADQTTMADVAAATLGTHYHATNAAALIQAFRDIANALPTLLTR